MEYAVKHLQVPSILVCGHSGCVAMHGLLGGQTINGSLGRWLRWVEPSLLALRGGHPVGLAAAAQRRNEVDQLSMVNVAHPRPSRTPELPAYSCAPRTNNPGRLTTIASWVLRAITTTASDAGSGFSSRCGTNGGTKM